MFVHLGAYDRAGTIFRADPVTQIFVEREFRLHSPPDWRERKDTGTLKDVMTRAARPAQMIARSENIGAAPAVL